LFSYGTLFSCTFVFLSPSKQGIYNPKKESRYV
jgi:hypothetical protein